MTARVTQQVLIVAYTTTPAARVTAMAVEVIRSTGSIAASANKPNTVIVASS